MNPVAFEQANKVLKAPEEMPDVIDVYAFVQDGQTITCWQPDPEERAIIAAGGPVWLRVLNEGMHPSSVEARLPFIEPEPDERRQEEINDGAPHCGNCVRFDKTASRCVRWMRMTFAHHVCGDHKEIGQPKR